MANDKAFKIKNGLSAKRYLQSSTAVAASDVDMSLGSYFTKTLSANTTFTFSNPPASGNAGSFALEVTGADVTVGYDLANASYDSVFLSVGSQDTAPSGITFNNDGTKLYLTGDTNNSIYQYSLSTAFDLSTASYDSVSFSVSGQDSQPQGIAFNNDGTKMYLCGSGSDSVYQYTLSTAFDLSTASYDSVSFSITAQEEGAKGITLNNDGTKMYIVGQNTTSAYQYSLSTAFDLSTASYDSVSFNFSSQGSGNTSIVFNNDGTKLYMVGTVNDTIFQYSLSTAFDLSTVSYDSVSFNVSSQDTVPQGLAFNNDGTKLYMVGSTNDRAYQYSTGTTSPATITYPASVKWSGATTPDAPAAGEKDVYVFVTTDGGTTYYGKQAAQGVA